MSKRQPKTFCVGDRFCMWYPDINDQQCHGNGENSVAKCFEAGVGILGGHVVIRIGAVGEYKIKDKR